MEAHAQEEIRAYATVIGEQIVARWVPVTWEAFLDYRKRAMVLSGLEVALVAALAAGDTARALAVATEHGIVKRTADGRLAPNVERAEIDEKLRALGWEPPWEAAR
jgi:thymidylate synthase (FAD)